MLLLPDQHTDDNQVREYNANCEGCGIEADRIVDRAGEQSDRTPYPSR